MSWVKIGDVTLHVSSVTLAGGAFVVKAKAPNLTTVIAAGAQELQVIGTDKKVVAVGRVVISTPITGTTHAPAMLTLRVAADGTALSKVAVDLVDV